MASTGAPGNDIPGGDHDPGSEPERRMHPRAGAGTLALTIDLGFGPLTVVDWSPGGARLRGAALALAVGEFATGTITAGGRTGPFIADVVRTYPPHLDPRHPPEEISLRWLELPGAVLAAMIQARAPAPSGHENPHTPHPQEDPHG